MSTPTGEPLIGQDYETRERLCNQDAIAVAGDREAMKAALQEYAVRLMFEHGILGYKWLTRFSDLFDEAGKAAITEYLNAPVNRGKVPF